MGRLFRESSSFNQCLAMVPNSFEQRMNIGKGLDFDSIAGPLLKSKPKMCIKTASVQLILIQPIKLVLLLSLQKHKACVNLTFCIYSLNNGPAKPLQPVFQSVGW